MKPNDLNTALYEKMAAEQDKYRDWLKSQPPAEVLDHAYECAVREDIVMAMEELEQFRASNNANLQCKEAIEAAVREHFDGMYLSHNAARGVIITSISSAAAMR